MIHLLYVKRFSFAQASISVIVATGGVERKYSIFMSN